MDQGNPSTSSAHRPTKWNYLLPSGKKKVQGAKKKSVTRDNNTYRGENNFFPFFTSSFVLYTADWKIRNEIPCTTIPGSMASFDMRVTASSWADRLVEIRKKTNNNRKIRDAGWWWRRFPSGYPLLLRERNQTEKKQVDRKHTQISSGRIQLCRSRAAFSSFSCVGGKKKKKRTTDSRAIHALNVSSRLVEIES